MAVATPTRDTWAVDVRSAGLLVPGIPVVATVARGQSHSAGSLIVGGAATVVSILAKKGCREIVTSDAELLALDGERGVRIAEARAR